MKGLLDPALHPYKKRHLIAHGLAHHLFHRDIRVNYFRDEKDDFLKSLKVRKMEGSRNIRSLPLNLRRKTE
jgi:Zn-dependent peptidase ImmA (M78 family)